MALRQIIKEGDDVLRKVSRPVSKFDNRLHLLIDDMVQTMQANHGIGLAAPQVGVLRRLFVYDLQDGEGPQAVVNPRFVLREGLQVGQEGCLSVPGMWGDVERPARVVVEGQDRNGNPLRVEATGLKAVCLCHENDHLDGILFRDKVVGELRSE